MLAEVITTTFLCNLYRDLEIHSSSFILEEGGGKWRECHVRIARSNSRRGVEEFRGSYISY